MCTVLQSADHHFRLLSILNRYLSDDCMHCILYGISLDFDHKKKKN